MMRSLTVVNGSKVKHFVQSGLHVLKEVRPERSKVESSALSSAPGTIKRSFGSSVFSMRSCTRGVFIVEDQM
jgi:hypothetical protein